MPSKQRAYPERGARMSGFDRMDATIFPHFLQDGRYCFLDQFKDGCEKS